MEELKQELEEKFVEEANIKETGELFRFIEYNSDFIQWLITKVSQVEPEVSQENGGRECPLCGGKNKKEFGGNDECFHCENETCGFVQCEQSADDVIYMVSKRIKKFYKG